MNRISTIDDYLKTPAHPLRQRGGCRPAVKRECEAGRPLVTVTTIVKDRQDTLAQAILSVLNQSYPNIEYIVVDGASTDGTLEVIKQFDDRIDLWISEPDCGTSEAFNKAVSVAQGNFIFWLSSDDWIDRHFIEKSIEALLTSGADFVFGNMVMYKNGHKAAVCKADRDYAKSLMSGYPRFNFPTMVIKKECFEKVGLTDVTYKLVADYEWLLRLHLNGQRGFYNSSLVVHRRVGGIGERHVFKSALEHLRLLRQYRLPKTKAMATYLYYLVRRGMGYCARLLLPAVIYKKLKRAGKEEKENIAPANIKNLLARLWHHISQHRRFQFALLLGLMVMSAFAEMVTLGAVLPFLGAITAPERVFSHSVISNVAQAWGITSAGQLVLPLTVLFALAALVGGVVRLLLLWTSSRLAFASGADLSIEVYHRTLYQPFRVHANLNSSKVISGISNKTMAVAFGVLLPVLKLISSAVLLGAIILVLLAIDAMVACIAAAIFGFCYGLITRLSRRQLQRSSQDVAKEQTKVVQALQEGLGGIRDVLLDNAQPFYCDIYRQANHPLWKAQHNIEFVSGYPKFVMETFGIVLITALAYGLSRQPSGVATALPVLGALALGAQRLLPALQQIYFSWTAIAATQASLTDVLELIEQPLPAEIDQPRPAPLLFHDAIRFDNVSFRYTSDGPWILDGINFTIPKGARVGFIGRTGSGKSTALDLLMGLLDPDMGQVLVDGQPINGKRRRAWQQNIAHVPQSIYLADTSLAENIAFSVPKEAIDFDRVRQAARQAQIAEFIESQPKGYQTFVGERGIRLSGGQCQRIGIARALYKQANVLVFDEATSALDSATEQAVLDAIESFSSDITILIIAHRLTIMQWCDTVIEFRHESGR